ncbi:metallophosphoesterase family protein [Halocatena halophila]|uniref:metallophosphoesterase family protein n=1 Tax=Halocatena halophila TaxID=2814576 RepID=UPI002ED65C80
MQIGVIADVHANRPALEAVLEAMGPVDRLLCAGDIVGYNPYPAWCVDRVQESMICVQGNHDRLVDAPEPYRSNRMAYAGLCYAQEQLREKQLRWLDSLPEERTLFDGAIRMVHSHPVNRDQYVRPAQFSSLEPHLGSEAVLILGHTHMQHTERVGETLICNPGSVGQPRDSDPRAGFAVINTDDFSVTTHRVAYDIDRVQNAIKAAGLPSETGDRLESGR